MIKEIRTLPRSKQPHITSYQRRGVLKRYYAVYEDGVFIKFLEMHQLKPYHFKQSNKIYNAYDLKEYEEYLKTAKRGRLKKQKIGDKNE